MEAAERDEFLAAAVARQQAHESERQQPRDERSIATQAMLLQNGIRNISNLMDDPSALSAYDWEWGHRGKPNETIWNRPEPESDKERWRIAYWNYWHVMNVVQKEIEYAQKLSVSPTNQDDDLRIAAHETLVCLVALNQELANDAYEEAAFDDEAKLSDGAECVQILEDEIERVNSVMRTTLAMTGAKLWIQYLIIQRHPGSIPTNQNDGRWSPGMPVKKWLAVFKEAGCPISEDTLGRHIDKGVYVAKERGKRNGLRLELSSIEADIGHHPLYKIWKERRPMIANPHVDRTRTALPRTNAE